MVEVYPVDVHVRIEIYDGHREGMRREERPVTKPKPRNDFIWHAQEAAPSPSDWRYHGYVRVTCETSNEVRSVLRDCKEFIASGHYARRIVWARTPFTDQQLQRIQRPITDTTLPPIPRLTFAEFRLATLPMHSQMIADYYEAERDRYAAAKAYAEQEAAASKTDEARDVWLQHASVSEEIRADREDERTRYARMVSKEDTSVPLSTLELEPPKVNRG